MASENGINININSANVGSILVPSNYQNFNKATLKNY
ncbi:hypothetical protein J2T59_001958 [Methanosalsum natronophilum]|nr:hypothetical protein [Methanosalsum natronophilum]